MSEDTEKKYRGFVREIIEIHDALLRYVGATKNERRELMGENGQYHDIYEAFRLANGDNPFGDEGARVVAGVLEQVLRNAGVEIGARQYTLNGEPVQLEEGEQR